MIRLISPSSSPFCIICTPSLSSFVQGRQRTATLIDDMAPVLHGRDGVTCNCTQVSTVERPRANASEPVPQDDEQQHFWVSEHARKTSGRAPDSAWRSVGHDADVTSCSHMSGFEVCFPALSDSRSRGEVVPSCEDQLRRSTHSPAFVVLVLSAAGSTPVAGAVLRRACGAGVGDERWGVRSTPNIVPKLDPDSWFPPTMR